ncbi:hypothetical protein CEE37_09670 [candidate division LCP-89 bacterium B3_LCP]|uniref:RNA 2-O ribose methyltransferase substrate binding domain-containing protein n=1 Tax=candidate division LCP-89 bacterium B3_LCP TaxID=2012998 RepID=A0A532UYF5_UNCL8|nr:MAG: hypothetical protein CEE37_09670 [candidate division LCP-89 bacterium B3_LCP]
MEKNRIKLYRSLHKAGGRDERGLFLVEGPELIKEALREGWPLEEVQITHSFVEESHAGKELIKLIDLADVPYYLCSNSDMGRISETKTPQGAIALARYREPVSRVNSEEEPEIIVICTCISDPGNLGTILRTADWFGIGRVILGEGSADPFAPKVVRASAGSIFRLKVESANDTKAIIKRETKSGRKLYAATTGGQLLPGELPQSGLRGLVMGHETKGIPDDILSICTETVRVGGRGKTESLNLAVAAGILLNAVSNE